MAASYRSFIDSHMFVEVRSDIRDDNDGFFRCCESRSLVDQKLDELKAELTSVHPTSYSKFRNVACHLGCRENERADNVDVDKMLIELIGKTWVGTTFDYGM